MFGSKLATTHQKQRANTQLQCKSPVFVRNILSTGLTKCRPLSKQNHHAGLTLLQLKKERIGRMDATNLTDIAKDIRPWEAWQCTSPLKFRRSDNYQRLKEDGNAVWSLKKKLAEVFRKQNNWVEENKGSAGRSSLRKGRNSFEPNITSYSPNNGRQRLTNALNESSTRLQRRQREIIREVQQMMTNAGSPLQPPLQQAKVSKSSFCDYTCTDLSEIVDRRVLKEPNRTLLQNNIPELQKQTNLSRKQLHHLFTFHQAMLADAVVKDSNKRIRKAVKLSLHNVVRALSVLTNIPVETIESSLRTQMSSYQRDMRHFDLSHFPTFVEVVNTLRREVPVE